MRREEHLTSPSQYAAVYSKGCSVASRLLVLRAMPNGLTFSRYGISVSRRVGKAVARNRVKRRIREILRAVPAMPGWDIVFIARPAVAGADYASVRETVMELLRRAKLLVIQRTGAPPSPVTGTRPAPRVARECEEICAKPD